MAHKSKAVTLLGAGTQGTRLAFMWSRGGRPVYLVDQNQKQLDRAVTGIEKLKRGWTQEKPSKWGEILPVLSKSLQDAVAESWLVVECVPESIDTKRRVIKLLDQMAKEKTIIASNSSSYTIHDIMKGLDLKHRERLLSLHSYWPPETSGKKSRVLLQSEWHAIEVLGSETTPEGTIKLLMEETKKHGFEPFHVKRESIGYIYNRIWAAIKRETLLTISEGAATPEEIDSIFKNVLKTPKGPCEQMDVVGLDVVLDIEEHYAETREGVPEGPRKLLKEMIAHGKLGQKSGSGFYDYESKP